MAMYHSNKEQINKQMAALNNVREKAMADPTYAEKLLKAVNSPRTSDNSTQEKAVQNHAKSSTK